MRWEDERYVRVYTRDTVDWQVLSFDAQSLFCLLLRKVDRAGILELGRHGKRAIAVAIGHPQEWERLEPALDELLQDGCMELRGDKLVVVNFIEAQEANASDKARQRESRARARDRAASRNVIEGHESGRSVTSCDATVTPGHTTSHAVTPSCAVLSRADLSPSEKGGQVATPRQGDLHLEPKPDDDPTDMPGQEAIWAVFAHWRNLYPEHAKADLRGSRPKLIKQAIASRRKALGCSRRKAVESVNAALDQAQSDPYLSGQERDGKVKTELAAILETATFERLCRMANGTEPDRVVEPKTDPRIGLAYGDA